MAKKTIKNIPRQVSSPRMKRSVKEAETLQNSQDAFSFVQADSSPIGNGLGSAIGYGSFNPFGMPTAPGIIGTEQVENVGTIFKNLRWTFITNLRQVLSQAYCEIGLIKTIVDTPINDALRGGIEIKSKQLSEEQIEKLHISIDRDNDLETVGQAAKWNRLFGGAGICIFTDQDPELPLDLKAIGPDTPFELRAVDMWELFWTLQNTEGYDPSIQDQNFVHYNYYGDKLHKSRVMRLKGLEAPSFLRPRLRGWGLSVVEILVRSINQYLKATDLGFEVLDEFKLDIYKIKNLVNTLASPQGEQKIRQRIQMANWQKNYQNALVMDSEDDHDSKQLSFAGLAEAMAGIRMQVAADMRFPLTKLFGISAAGFNSGEDDIEVYNAMVESEVRNKIKYDLLRVCEIKCQKLFGMIPQDLSIQFKPLRVLSAEQEETVKTQKFTRLEQAVTRGLISIEEFRHGVNKGDLLDIKLGSATDVLNPDDPEMGEEAIEGNQDPVDPKDIDDPGADRADTKKARTPQGEYGGSEPKGVAKDGNAPKEAKQAKEAPIKPVKNNYPPCKNPHCKSFGKSHPNCTCYNSVEGEDFCNSLKEHEEGCSYYTEPQPSTTQNAEYYLRSQYPHLMILPRRYTLGEKALRTLNNSAAFDRASYEADGGDQWIDPARAALFQDPRNVDQALWGKAREASQKSFGEIKWQFVVWFYKKQGGLFQ